MDQLREAILWLRRSTDANPNLGINYSLLAAACSLDGLTGKAGQYWYDAHRKLGLALQPELSPSIR
jgi:hypothetical protein